MPLLGETDRPEVNLAALESSAPKQRRQMLLAMALLLTALILVLFRYRQFWLPSTASEEEVTQTAPNVEIAKKATPDKSRKAKSKQHAEITVATATSPQGAMSPTITERSVVTPYQVEVMYGGGQHQTIRTRSAPLYLEVQPIPAGVAEGQDLPSPPGTATTSPPEQVRLSPETLQAVTHSVGPSYPPLAQQMNVQGSVVLQVRIGKDGNIRDLQVVSGPDILAEAARDAVRQWRFKPYYQAGKPVETEAHITVNFSISTH